MEEGSGLGRLEVGEGPAELVGRGLDNAVCFAGLGWLRAPSDRRAARHRRRGADACIEDAGRWALARRARPQQGGSPAGPDAVEHLALSLLRRYGVVFWRLLEREAAWLPPWRDLLRVYRRLEARGRIPGAP